MFRRTVNDFHLLSGRKRNVGNSAESDTIGCFGQVQKGGRSLLSDRVAGLNRSQHPRLFTGLRYTTQVNEPEKKDGPEIHAVNEL
jgi:hypothetical protein